MSDETLGGTKSPSPAMRPANAKDMAAGHTSDVTSPRALLVSDATVSSNDLNVRKLLDFFAIPWSPLGLQMLHKRAEPSWDLAAGKLSILGSASSIATMLKDCPTGLTPLLDRADSVYVYGFEASEDCNSLLRFVTNDGQACVQPLDRTAMQISVAGDFPTMCGPLSDMRMSFVPGNGDFFFSLQGRHESNPSAIATVDGDRKIFVRVMWRGVPFYLTACASVIDIHERVLKYFDMKTNFCRAVPIAIYLKSLGADAWPTPTENSACLIVDDPLLRIRYGFLHLGRTMELMDDHNFAMTIGFIPWNWRRTDPRAVQLLQAWPNRVSLSIHGCDHTRGEFVNRSTAALNAKTRTACERMESLFQRTHLRYDRIMIFPHGGFSTESVQVLKANGFIAAVNTEVAPSPDSTNQTDVADVWDVAIERYGTFPVFTRRYPWHGIENFAFDGLLGKPCLIAAHHDDFKNNAHDLLDFVDRLNSLKWNLHWRTLGDAISHSTRVRNRKDATNIVQLFSNHTLMSNRTDKTSKVLCIKREQNAASIRTVTANGGTVSWTCRDGYLRFEQIILPGRTAEVCITYSQALGNDPYPSGIAYGMRTRMRRYLCELRDNYLSQSNFLDKQASRLRRLLNRRPPPLYGG